MRTTESGASDPINRPGEPESGQLLAQIRTLRERVPGLAILSVDVRGRIDSWSFGAKQIFGYQEDEIVHQPFAVLFTPEDRAAGAPDREIQRAAESGVSLDDRWHQGKDQTQRFLSGVLVSVRDEKGELLGFTKVAQDHTERKRAEDALRESESQYRLLASELENRVAERTSHLEQSVATWESFCYSMAHDLRAPLRTISGFAQALLDDYGPGLDATARQYAARMMSAAHRLDEFIQDLLDFGRLAHADFPLKRLDLGREIELVLGRLDDDLVSSRAAVEVEKPFPQAWANPAALEQVLTNLLSNAIKFVPPGAAPHIEIRAEESDHAVRVWIRDHGIGIQPEYQERVFQLFERLHPHSTYPGTGVGLAIVRKAMERMGGRVGLVSEPGKGSSFWIELAKAESPDAPTAEQTQFTHVSL